MGKKSAKQVASFLGTSALTRPLFVLGAASVLLGAGQAQALDANTLPQNPNVVGGKDSFSQSGSTLNVNQSTNRTVIDWRSFDIGSKAQVNFNQPGTSSIAVNRINGSTNPTDIEGGLHANGQVWILNPNGVFFGKTAHVDAAGIVASTANIDAKAFMAGSNKLQMTGADHGSVENQGNISVGANGLAAFVAPSVRNSGVINATVGRVALAAGTTYTLDLAGDHLVELGLGSVKAVVDNSGKIVNPGGTIALTAKAAGQVVNSVVNVSGVVSASSVTKSGGTITLGGDNVTTTSTAQLSADAGTNGNGGAITSVANVQGNYAGSFSAKGGSASGNGGTVETSGKSVHVDNGITINTLASNGLTGSWTVDPDNLVIGTTDTGTDADTNQSISAATVESQLGTTSVDLKANNSITVNTAIDTSSNIDSNTLTFQDENGGGLTVNLNAGITLGAHETLTGQGTTVNVASTGLIQNGIDVALAGGATVNVAAGTYAPNVNINKSGITLLGASGAEIDVNPGSGQLNAINIGGGTDGVTVSGFKIRGEITGSYLDYAFGSGISRGVAVANGATNFTISNNDIENIRNGILIDGRNTGTVTGNLIDNTKGAISVQYTDAGAGNSEGYAINMSGNTQGAQGNEWGLNIHLNGNYVGGTVHSNPYPGGAAPGTVQTALLANSTANSGWTVQDQAYTSSNRTAVTVAAAATNANSNPSDANQGSYRSPLATIQAGISAVVSGGTVNVLDGTYTIASGSNYINVTKSLSLIGESEAGVIIDARNASTYGLRVSGPNSNVTLENFTLYGSTGAGNSYGLKAEDTNNLTLENITSRGATKSEFDLNGIINGTLVNLTADGAPVSDATDSTTTGGNGISFTNSQNITLTDSRTMNNAWGGLALYQGTTYGDLQLTGITVDGSNTFAEANGIYAEDQSSVTDIGTVDLSGQGITYIAQDLVAPNDFYTWFRTSQQAAIDTAAAAGSGAYVHGYVGNVSGDNTFTVGTSTGGHAMSIQAAVNAAAAGATINVGVGTYTDALNIGKNVDIEGAGSANTIIQPAALLTTGVGHKYDGNVKTAVYVHDANNVTINNVTIDANYLGANAVVFWNNASGTLSNAVIENPMVFSGAQTGQGIAVDATGSNTTTLTVDGVAFQDWNKNAIDAVTGDGTGTNGGTINLTVQRSSFTGAGDTGMIAQNGILAWEQGGGTVNATIDGDTFTGLSYNGPNTATATGVLQYGSANGTVTVKNSTFDVSVQEYISTAGGTAHGIDATENNTFDGVVISGSSTLDQLYAITNKITDGTDTGTDGLVRLVAGHVYATAQKDNLQAAVDVASAGDTVNVQAGTYTSALDIGKNLDIEGAGAGSTIIQPTTLLTTGVGHKYDSNVQTAVYVHDAGDVTLNGLTIDANNLGANAVVFWNNASGTISNSLIENPMAFGGAQTGQDLAVDATGTNTTNLTVSNVTFKNWNKNAIDAVTGDGSGTNGGDIVLNVSGSTFTGAGDTGTIAQNGILLWEQGGGSVSATVDNSSFSDLSYNDPNTATATGILVYGSPNGTLTVSNSTFDSSVQEYISTAGGSPNEVDATNGNTFGGVATNSATLDQLFVIQDKITDGLNDATNGLVRLVANNVYLTSSNGDIANAVDKASAGNTVNVQDGSYTLAGELDITKSLALKGESQNGTIITSNSTGYGINVTADNTSLQNFTFHGPTASGATYGIKATPDTNVASDRLLNFDIENVTIDRGYRTGLDLNGVLGATIKNVNVSNIVHGNGMALTDSANVTITGSTTSNNAWGGLALYQTNTYYDQQVNNIVVDGTNSFNDTIPVYTEDQSASQNFGSISLAGFNYVVQSPNNANDVYSWFQKTEQAAFDFATNAALSNNNVNVPTATVQGYSGSGAYGNNVFYVGTGSNAVAMSIGNAITQAASGGTVNVDNGTYAENVTDGTQLTFNFGDVTVNSFTLASGGAGSSLNGNLTATGAITSAGAASINGDFTAGSIALNGAVTLTGDTSLNASGNVTVASVTGGGNNLSLGGASNTLGNVAGVDALTVSGPATLTGTSYAANTVGLDAVTLTGDTTVDANTISVASVTGGGNDLTLDGATSLGNVAGAGALAVNGASTLTGSSYAGTSLNFGGAVTLTNGTSLNASGATTVASVIGGGNDLTITGASNTLGNVAGVGALAVNGAATLTGASYVAGSMDFDAVTLANSAALNTSSGNGALVIASVDGSSAGGQSLTLNAGSGKVSLGNVGATTRLGAVSDASKTTLTGSTYNANSFLFGGDVTLTSANTTLNTTQSAGAAGDITFQGDLFGTTDGGQSLTLIAGPGTGAASANGDITLQNAGTTAVNLNNLTVSGDNFTALTVDLAGNYNSQLIGNQVFAADTLNVKGNATSNVGGDASGHIVAGGDVNIVANGDVSGTINGNNVNLTGDDVNSIVTANNAANIQGNTVEGSYTADTVTLIASNNVNAAVNATDFTLSAQHGSVDGTWTTIDTTGSNVVSVNGQTTVGLANVNPNQLVVEGFVLPAGSRIGANGQLILPQGVLLGLLSPGGGKPKMILVHTVQQLGELLAGGYSVIVIDLSNRDSGKPIQLASN